MLCRLLPYLTHLARKIKGVKDFRLGKGGGILLTDSQNLVALALKSGEHACYVLFTVSARLIGVRLVFLRAQRLPGRGVPARWRFSRHNLW